MRLESSEESGHREFVFESEAAMAESVKPRNSGRAIDVEDLVTLTHLNEPGILHVLRRRFEAKKIYTSVGSILVAINPYRDVPALYAQKIRDDYRAKGERRERPAPHVFAVADAAFRAGGPQSILISGESGAG